MPGKAGSRLGNVKSILSGILFPDDTPCSGGLRSLCADSGIVIATYARQSCKSGKADPRFARSACGGTTLYRVLFYGMTLFLSGCPR
jgi:hypothetical protein